jgi:DNA-binding IclR family transcriptional regulator
MSRIRLGEELGIPAAALGRTIALLDEHGFVTWTRRFGVGLGVRFINHGEQLASHLEHTFSHHVRPHLEMLARDHGGSAFVGMRAGTSIMVPIAVGPDAAAQLSADANCVRVAEHATTRPWSHTELNHSVPIQGIWSAACGQGFATLAARVSLAHSAACIGFRIPTPNPAAYEAAGHALVASANQLTSSLRRQFPQ